MRSPTDSLTDPPHVERSRLVLLNEHEARLELTTPDGWVDGWDVPHHDSEWSANVQAIEEIVLVVTQSALVEGADGMVLLTEEAILRDATAGGVLAG